MPAAFYWDASAILSVLIEDRHSMIARRHLGSAEPPHLVSSMAFAEVCAVLTRLVGDEQISRRECRLAIGSLGARPWSALTISPDRRMVVELADRHSLRGADLWHLSAAATLARELPDLVLLTFDRRLATAAHGEGLPAAPG